MRNLYRSKKLGVVEKAKVVTGGEMLANSLRAAAPVAILLTVLPQFAAPAYSEPITSAQIKCGDVVCGTMDINTYTEHKNDTLGGVLIEGKFSAAKARNFHYMQSVLQTTTRKWVDGTDLTVPYVDTPPVDTKAMLGITFPITIKANFRRSMTKPAAFAR
jgi:hypothetical protein